jgi:hypothetical protein
VNRLSSALAAAAFTAAVTLGAIFAPSASATEATASAAASPTIAITIAITTTVPAPPDTINDFLPQDQNLGTCIGSLERPGCNTSNKSDFRTYLTFAALTLALAFIGWRITIGVKQRDRENTKPSGNTF